MKINRLIIQLIALILCVLGCENKDFSNQKGTFLYDLTFLKKHYKNTFLLSQGDSRIIVTPELQGRVMTSIINANEGESLGWINYDLIASGKIDPQFNPVGGEERFWIGPEGGQFSIYFEPNATFDFKNWKVPNVIDTEEFELIYKTSTEAHFQKETSLFNYSGHRFELKVDRKIRLLDKAKGQAVLGTPIPDGLDMVAFESENSITNMGQTEWNKETGMLSIWILSMLKPSDETTVAIPFKKGNKDSLGIIVTDNYFGKVPPDRLKIDDGVLFFKADGKKRSKIGLSPKRALPFAGSYDSKNNILTIAQYTLEENQFDYVNSIWEIQDEPLAGDAVNSYNDGPLDNGEQLGPFYEIESSSRATNLKTDQKLTHIHRTFHFTGDENALNVLSVKFLNTPLKKIKL